MIYSINMHTTVYQFWRFVYHPKQSVIDHYARSSFYTRSFCTVIKLYVGHFLWPLLAGQISIFFLRPLYLFVSVNSLPSFPALSVGLPVHLSVCLTVCFICFKYLGQYCQSLELHPSIFFREVGIYKREKVRSKNLIFFLADRVLNILFLLFSWIVIKTEENYLQTYVIRRTPLFRPFC